MKKSIFLSTTLVMVLSSFGTSALAGESKSDYEQFKTPGKWLGGSALTWGVQAWHRNAVLLPAEARFASAVKPHLDIPSLETQVILGSQRPAPSRTAVYTFSNGVSRANSQTQLNYKHSFIGGHYTGGQTTAASSFSHFKRVVPVSERTHHRYSSKELSLAAPYIQTGEEIVLDLDNGKVGVVLEGREAPTKLTPIIADIKPGKGISYARYYGQNFQTYPQRMAQKAALLGSRVDELNAKGIGVTQVRATVNKNAIRTLEEKLAKLNQEFTQNYGNRVMNAKETSIILKRAGYITAIIGLGTLVHNLTVDDPSEEVAVSGNRSKSLSGSRSELAESSKDKPAANVF